MRTRSSVSALLVGVLATTGLLVSAVPASAAPPDSTVSITKTGPGPESMPLAPGATFNYVIEVTCNVANCYDAAVTDTLPPPLVLNGTPTIVGEDPFSIITSDTTGDGVDDAFEIDFIKDFEDIANPGSGMTAGNITTITIPVKVPDDADYDYSGVELVNTGSFDATNATNGPQTSDWPITIDVPLDLATTVDKSFDPTSGTAREGELTTATINAQNSSETGADSFAIIDPAPGSASNTFDYLDLEAIRITEIPDGADQVTITVNTTGGPVSQTLDIASVTPLPFTVDLTGIDPATVTGVEVEFLDDGTAPRIAEDATAGIELDLVQEDPGTLTDDTVVMNWAGSEVNRDDDTATGTSNEADYTIETNIPTVAIDKDFDPDFVVHGESSVATITAGVDGSLPVESLTITEPDPGVFSPDGLHFEGFDGPVVFPEEAEEGTLTLQTTGGPVVIDLDDGEIPDLTGVDVTTVTSFSITFTSTDGEPIPPGGTDASVPVIIGTPPLDGVEQADYLNEVSVTGTTEDGVNGTDADNDTLFAFDEHIDTVTGKTITPSDVLGWAGNWVVLQLSGGIAGDPVDGNTDDPYSTVGADEIIVQDPIDPENSDFWDAFNPDSIVDVSVPAGTTLTVNYYDTTTDSWVQLTTPTVGDGVFNYTFPPPNPEDIGGLQFVYTPTNPDEPFDPGTEFKPNVVMGLDQDWLATVDWGDDGLVELTNCAVTDAEGTGGSGDPVTPEAPAEACAPVTVEEPDPDGNGPDIDKTFVTNSGDLDASIPGRSHQTTNARILWSTGGVANVDQMTIVDEADAPAADTGVPFDSSDSFYDAFDLVRVSVTDPLLQYDAVDAVQIFNGDTGQWVTPANTVCDGVIDGSATAACQGAMPEFNLNQSEQSTTVAVRVIFIENPDSDSRATVSGEIVPPVGSGVARSDQSDGRTVDLRFRVRDWLRSDNAVPVDESIVYNLTDPGDVGNTAAAQSESTVNGDSTVTDGTNIVITAADLSVSATKTWDGSPVGIPPVGTQPSFYPHTGVGLTVTNDSQIAYVDELSLEDRPTLDRPDPDTLLMSDVFNIESIEDIVLPDGADGFTLNMYCDESATPCLSTSDMNTAVNVWGLTEMADVVGLELIFHGRNEPALGAGDPTTGGIHPNATGSIDFLLQLRETDRYRGNTLNDPDDEIVYAGQLVNNVVTGTVDDAAAEPVTTDDIPADVLLDEFEVAVAVTKGFTDSAPADMSTWQDPYTQVETTPESSDEFIMWLGVVPTAGARPVTMTVSDLDPSFWNVYEFVRVDDAFFRTVPIENTVMQVCLNSENPISGSLGGAISGGCERTAETDGTATYSGLAADSYDGTGVPTLPGSYTAEDVNGLVFTFSSADAWDNPWNPFQSVPVVVKRRDVMLTGDAPPTDLVGNLAAPGETLAGHSVNEIYGEITALLGEDGGTDLGISSNDAEDDATVIYEHSITSAEVVKSPGGPDDPAQLLSPGAPIEFELTFTNTGETPIYNPVFTDLIPDSDGDGNPDLIINENVILAGDSPYSFTLDDSAAEPLPAPWVAPSTDVDDVTITPTPATGDPDEIEFSYPGEQVALAVGASFTITIQMVPQAGISPSVTFTNTAVIDGDRSFDYCETDDGDPANYFETCEGEATNAVAEGGAIRTVKYVRAGDTDNPDYTLGAFVDGATDVACDPTTGEPADGFFASPCVPRTQEGQIETWRLSLQNTGNVPLTTLVAVDRLPAVGDQTVLPPQLDRGSQWGPILVDPVASFQNHPAGGGVLDVYVTTDAVPCTDEMTGGDCGGAWLDWDTYTGDLADVTGIMYVATFPDDTPLLPREYLTVDVETMTPGVRPPSEDSIAYNSVAVSAVTETGTQVAATEGVKVGVALATGSIAISKALDGDGADEYALDDYTVELVCTVDIDGETVEVIRDEYTLTAGDPATVVDTLPTGATCTLEESDYGQWDTTIDPDEVVVPFGDSEEVSIELTNVYRLASLEVGKVVVGDDGGSGVDPGEAGEFLIGVACVYRDEYVTATNTDDWVPLDGYPMIMTVSLEHLESVVLDDLPAGATCIAGEYPEHGASRVGIVWENDTDFGFVVEEADGELIYMDELLTLTPNAGTEEAPEPTNFIEFINQFASGELEISKTLSGPGADAHVGEEYQVAVYCEAVDPDDPDHIVVTFDDTVTVVGGETTTVGGILVGSECVLTEEQPDEGGPDQWVFDPAQDGDTSIGVVTIEDDGTDTPVAQIAVDNRYEVPTELVVDKIVDGPILNEAGDIPDVGPFAIEVVCTYAEGTPYEREVFAAEFASNDPGTPMMFDLMHGESETLTDLPTGTVCDVTETDTASASESTVTVHPAGETAETSTGTATSIGLNETGIFTTNRVTFTNTYPIGALVVTKEVTGDGAAERGDGPFIVHVECTSDEFGITSYTGDLTLGGDQPLEATVTNILAPSTCVVTETDDAGADTVTYTPGEPGDSSATVQVLDGEEAEAAAVTVTNFFEAFASLEVTKTVDESVMDAEGNVPDLGPYWIAVQCVYDEGGVNEHPVYADGYGPLAPMIAALDNGETAVFENLPANSSCTVTELYNGGAASTTVTVVTADAEPTVTDGAQADLVLTPGDTNSAEVLNVFAVGSLELVKEIVGAGAEDATEPFAFTIECTWERPDVDPVTTYSGTVVLGGGAPLTATIDGIAAGSVCIVTETDNGGADDTRLVPAGDGDVEASVTIGADATVTVTAYNQFDEDATGVLPLTGYQGWWILMMALLTLGLGGALILIARRREF
ncbi:isopeptide-forming domain-containing fimbrial protein [Demequina sp. B12]|uniref:DUF5979 domain-containing protein n=1 Tax=Demequina sp. B12 TaxID=2992757 RepID=UPI00237AE8BC|nr:DUF5979 domain-containing protein [Demequina sp. B12]MDE0572030.1 isopeptide-forming domain-containing fimbrial protein [Demequina sp. B12]